MSIVQILKFSDGSDMIRSLSQLVKPSATELANEMVAYWAGDKENDAENRVIR